MTNIFLVRIFVLFCVFVSFMLTDTADSSGDTPQRASATISNYINKATKTIDKKYLKQAIEKRKQPPEGTLILHLLLLDHHNIYFAVLYKRKTYAEQKEAYQAKQAKDKKKK